MPGARPSILHTMFTLTRALPAPADTDRLAADLARILRAGDTVLLDGGLGMGKSHLARHLIQTMQAPHGPVEDVPSPTYTLVQTYRAGDIAILHADLYRLGDPSELVELGLEEALGRDLCLIEWPDRLDTAPPDALTLAFAADGDGRVVTLYGDDNTWAERLARIEGTHDGGQ